MNGIKTGYQVSSFQCSRWRTTWQSWFCHHFSLALENILGYREICDACTLTANIQTNNKQSSHESQRLKTLMWFNNLKALLVIDRYATTWASQIAWRQSFSKGLWRSYPVVAMERGTAHYMAAPLVSLSPASMPLMPWNGVWNVYVQCAEQPSTKGWRMIIIMWSL